MNFPIQPAMQLSPWAGAKRGKASAIINPAEPPMIMRDTKNLLKDADVVLRLEVDDTAINASSDIRFRSKRD